MPYLLILRKFWWAIPLLILLSALGISRLEIRHLRTANAGLEARIATLETITAQNVQKALHDKETADAAYQSSSKAAAMLGADLSSRVRDYENRLRAGALQGPGEPIQAVGGSTPATPAPDPVVPLIGDAIAACSRDAARLDNAHEWAAGLAGGPAAPHP